MGKTNNGNSADDLMLLAVDYFLNGHLEKAEEYCRKAKALNSYNFEALRLLAHINFIKGSFFLAQFYFEDALKNVRNAHENYNILMQLAIYQIYHGDTENAYSNIEQAKRINGKSKCQLCENLIQDYIPKRYKTN